MPWPNLPAAERRMLCRLKFMTWRAWFRKYPYLNLMEVERNAWVNHDYRGWKKWKATRPDLPPTLCEAAAEGVARNAALWAVVHAAKGTAECMKCEPLALLLTSVPAWNLWRAGASPIHTSVAPPWPEPAPPVRIDLSGTDLAGACLAGADLSGVNLQAAILDGADLRECDLSRSCLLKARLMRADLRNVRAREACFCGATVQGADLTGAELDGCDLQETWR